MNMDTLLQADTDLLLALNGSSSQFVDGLMMALTSGFTWIPMYVALLYLVVKNSETMGASPATPANSPEASTAPL